MILRRKRKGRGILVNAAVKGNYRSGSEKVVGGTIVEI